MREEPQRVVAIKKQGKWYVVVSDEHGLVIGEATGKTFKAAVDKANENFRQQRPVKGASQLSVTS